MRLLTTLASRSALDETTFNAQTYIIANAKQKTVDIKCQPAISTKYSNRVSEKSRRYETTTTVATAHALLPGLNL